MAATKQSEQDESLSVKPLYTSDFLLSVSIRDEPNKSSSQVTTPARGAEKQTQKDATAIEKGQQIKFTGHKYLKQYRSDLYIHIVHVKNVAVFIEKLKLNQHFAICIQSVERLETLPS